MDVLKQIQMITTTEHEEKFGYKSTLHLLLTHTTNKRD